MSGSPDNRSPVLLCFDGSDGAAAAVAEAGGLLAPHPAVVLTVWEPLELWTPYDPASLIDAGIAKVTSEERDLDDIAHEMAERTAERGAELARAAGFEASARVVGGKVWKAICEAAEELDARLIVVGARGLSPVASVLLGSVSTRVMAHAGRPVLVGRPERA